MNTLRNTHGYAYSYTDGSLIAVGDRIRWAVSTRSTCGGWESQQGTGTVLAGEGNRLTVLADEASHNGVSRHGQTNLKHTGEPVSLWFQGGYNSAQHAYGFSGSLSKVEACLTCQHEAYHERTGVYPSAQARQHAILWGCTCEPEDAEAAQQWMDLVSQ
jgi:hypothetical protein